MEEKRQGTVTEVTDTEATVVMDDDGSTRVVSIPGMVMIEVGMKVKIIDFGDDKPIYAWGL